MGILQEYKFFLIITIIALVAIISLFFNTQKSQEYVDFTTNLQASFAQIKWVASDTKNINAVYTVDGINIKGLKNNSLFGLTLDGVANDITINDEFISNGTTFPGTEPTPSNGKFKITLATTTPFVLGDTDGTVSAAAAGTSEALVGSTVTNASSQIAKGWDLDANGYILYTFEDAKTAKNVIDQYIPEGTLIGTWTVAVKFIR